MEEGRKLEKKNQQFHVDIHSFVFREKKKTDLIRFNTTFSTVGLFIELNATCCYRIRICFNYLRIDLYVCSRTGCVNRTRVAFMPWRNQFPIHIDMLAMMNGFCGRLIDSISRVYGKPIIKYEIDLRENCQR